MGSGLKGSPKELHGDIGASEARIDRGQSAMQLVQSDDEPELAAHDQREEATTIDRGARILEIRLFDL